MSIKMWAMLQEHEKRIADLEARLQETPPATPVPPPREIRYRCKRCEDDFSSVGLLRKHQIRDHGDKPFGRS